MSPAKLFSCLLQQFGINLPFSQLNDRALDFLTSKNSIQSSYADTFREFEGVEGVGFDYYKSYSSILYNNECAFPTFTLGDVPVEYDGQELTPGHYYIEKPDLELGFMKLGNIVATERLSRRTLSTSSVPASKSSTTCFEASSTGFTPTWMPAWRRR